MPNNTVNVSEILPGTRTEIRILQQVLRSKTTAEDIETHPSSVFDVLSSGGIEINVPIEKGKLVLLDMALRYELLFTTEKGLIRARGRFTKRYKRENFPIMLFECETPPERYQRREFYRLDCFIPLSYVTLDDEADEIKRMEEVTGLLNEEGKHHIIGTGTILDISGGGMRFVTENDLEDTKFLLLEFPIEEKGGKEQIEVIGKIKGVIPVDANGNSTYRIQILFKDSGAQERIVHYIFEEERRIRRKERGQE